MFRLALVLAIVPLVTVSAFTQSFPEVDAMQDVFFAKDVDAALVHLPRLLQESLAELPQQEREEIGQHFLLAEQARREGVEITRPDDAQALAVIVTKQDWKREIVLAKRISDGYEAVLWLSLRDLQTKSDDRETIQVSMRYVDGSWRVYEIKQDYRGSINLDDPHLIERLSHTLINANEAAAVGALRTYNTACITYASTYPDIGYPPNLSVLDTDGTAEPTSDHSALIDASLTSPPYEKSGYQFTYHRLALGTYEIFARPTEFGRSGRHAFFTDQSGVIRATEEERAATADDSPLE